MPSDSTYNCTKLYVGNCKLIPRRLMIANDWICFSVIPDHHHLSHPSFWTTPCLIMIGITNQEDRIIIGDET